MLVLTPSLYGIEHTLPLMLVPRFCIFVLLSLLFKPNSLINRLHVMQYLSLVRFNGFNQLNFFFAGSIWPARFTPGGKMPSNLTPKAYVMRTPKTQKLVWRLMFTKFLFTKSISENCFCVDDVIILTPRPYCWKLRHFLMMSLAVQSLCLVFLCSNWIIKFSSQDGYVRKMPYENVIHKNVIYSKWWPKTLKFYNVTSQASKF